MPVDLPALLTDLGAETDSLIEVVTGAGNTSDIDTGAGNIGNTGDRASNTNDHAEDTTNPDTNNLRAVLATPTPAAGWTVGDTLGHLWFFDREARCAATKPDEFTAGLQALLADIDGYMQQALDAARELGVRLVPQWRAERAALIDALATAEPSARLPWYGPPMSPASSATARLMETWAHGQDIADALGVRREPTARLRHICHLGYRTRGFSYAVRGMTQPDTPVFVSLTPPGPAEFRQTHASVHADESLQADHGEAIARWDFGPADAADRITGTALDFCLLVTQRRVLEDLDLTLVGPAAGEWAGIAQVFAGTPTNVDPARSGLAR